MHCGNFRIVFNRNALAQPTQLLLFLFILLGQTPRALLCGNVTFTISFIGWFFPVSICDWQGKTIQFPYPFPFLVICLLTYHTCSCKYWKPSPPRDLLIVHRWSYKITINLNARCLTCSSFTQSRHTSVMTFNFKLSARTDIVKLLRELYLEYWIHWKVL